MAPITVGPWSLNVDHEATRRAYDLMESGGADRCSCDPCRNFVASRAEVYPAIVLAIFEQMGIDPRKDIEIIHYGLLSGAHLYGGWFYAVGAVESGPPRVVDNVLKKEPLALNFEACVFTADKPWPPFRGLECIQFDFLTRLPWRIDAPECD